MTDHEAPPNATPTQLADWLDTLPKNARARDDVRRQAYEWAGITHSVSNYGAEDFKFLRHRPQTLAAAIRNRRHLIVADALAGEKV